MEGSSSQQTRRVRVRQSGGRRRPHPTARALRHRPRSPPAGCPGVRRRRVRLLRLHLPEPRAAALRAELAARAAPEPAPGPGAAEAAAEAQDSHGWTSSLVAPACGLGPARRHSICAICESSCPAPRAGRRTPCGAGVAGPRLARDALSVGRQARRGAAHALLPTPALPPDSQVTLADSSSTPSRLQGRHFEGVLEATLENKRRYSQQHGYTFVDASSLLDGGCRWRRHPRHRGQLAALPPCCPPAACRAQQRPPPPRPPSLSPRILEQDPRGEAPPAAARLGPLVRRRHARHQRQRRPGEPASRAGQPAAAAGPHTQQGQRRVQCGWARRPPAGPAP
jgi:hypothetical protein